MNAKPIKAKMKTKIRKAACPKARRIGGIWIDPLCFPYFDYKGK